MNHHPRIAFALGAALSLVTACANEPSPDTQGTPNVPNTASPTSTPDPTTAWVDEHRLVDAAGTTFAVDLRGRGQPVLVIHGAGEDSSMLGPFADRLAAAGHLVVTYDRRGTGGSGRDNWPGSGAEQHSDDAAALLRALGFGPAQVVGLSSGGVIALDLAARHPDVVADAFVWEAPAAGVVPGGDAFTAEIVEQLDTYLDQHPGDFVGAQALLLSVIVGFPVAVDDPLFAAARANAEPMVRDDPTITLRRFQKEQFADARVTLAVGTAPNEIVAAASAGLSELIGHEAVVIDTDQHEAYISDPDGFAQAISAYFGGDRP